MGDYGKAEPYARMALAYSERTRPAIHPDISGELVNLSMLERELRNYKAAEAHLRRALAIDLAWYPTGHEETADVKRLLANVLFLEKHYQEAMPLAREAMREEEKLPPPDNRRRAYALQMVAVLDLAIGNTAEAAFLLRREIQQLTKLNDPTNLPAAYAYLGDAYMQQKQCRQDSCAHCGDRDDHHA